MYQKTTPQSLFVRTIAATGQRNNVPSRNSVSSPSLKGRETKQQKVSGHHTNLLLKPHGRQNELREFVSKLGKLFHSHIWGLVAEALKSVHMVDLLEQPPWNALVNTHVEFVHF